MHQMFSPITHMLVQPELVVDSIIRRTILTVECIASTGESDEEAVYLRDTLLPEEIEVDDLYFMLARVSVVNLWMPGSTRRALPDYTASVLPILRDHAHERIDDLDRAGLRQAIAEWLKSVSDWRDKGTSEVDKMLVKSGLHPKLRGAYVRDCS